MKRVFAAVLLSASLLLTGCGALLERDYVTAEPHSSRFWESDAAGTLRAENYQDIVNDLLILIGQHTESATVRLYNYEDDVTVADALERATTEVQQETSMGAYAVEYITASSRFQRGLLRDQPGDPLPPHGGADPGGGERHQHRGPGSPAGGGLDEGRTELAVRIGYWGEDGQTRVEEIVSRLREERGLTETPPWTISYYPPGGPVGLIEFVMDQQPADGDGAAAVSGAGENLEEEA